MFSCKHVVNVFGGHGHEYCTMQKDVSMGSKEVFYAELPAAILSVAVGILGDAIDSVDSLVNILAIVVVIYFFVSFMIRY